MPYDKSGSIMEERDYVIPEDVKKSIHRCNRTPHDSGFQSQIPGTECEGYFRRDFKGYRGTEGRGRMKNRILLLIWFILLALAAIFTGAWVYAVLLLLSALAVVAFLLLGFFCGKKVTMKLKLPKAAEQDGIWKGKLQIVNDSVLPVFLGKGSLHLENHFTGEQMELPFSFSLKGRGKKAIDFQGKSQWCGSIYATLHTWRSYDFFGIIGQKRKVRLSACTVVMPCEQKEGFSVSHKRGL